MEIAEVWPKEPAEHCLEAAERPQQYYRLARKDTTDKETWLQSFDDEIKTHSNGSSKKSQGQVWLNVKVLVAVFFKINDVLHCKFLPGSLAWRRPRRN